MYIYTHVPNIYVCTYVHTYICMYTFAQSKADTENVAVASKQDEASH